MKAFFLNYSNYEVRYGSDKLEVGQKTILPCKVNPVAMPLSAMMNYLKQAC